MAFDAADLAAFVDSDMPNYVAATVGAAPVAGLFRNAYASEFGIGGSAPSLLIASTDAPSATLGTAVVVGGVSYTVAGVEADVPGMKRLRLTEA